MANFSFKTWQTMNLDTRENDTNFIIFDHNVPDHQDQETEGIVYSGQILGGYSLQNLNEIFSQYVKCDPIDFTAHTQLDSLASKTFYVYYSSDNWSTYTSDLLTVTYDWSYDDNTSNLLSNPISKILDYRQYLLYSVGSYYSSTAIDVRVGDTVVDSVIVQNGKFNYIKKIDTIEDWPGEFNFDFSFDYLINESTIKPGWYYDLYVNNTRYIVALTCYRYCIYYLNQRGGWDSLLFKGKEIQNDKLSRLSYKKNYVAQSQEYNKVDYLTTIQETWQLNTAFMDDLNSSKMINLMSSNMLFLHDLDTQKIIPINITNSECTHKTYKNQNRKLYTYNIEVSASQPKYRI